MVEKTEDATSSAVGRLQDLQLLRQPLPLGLVVQRRRRERRQRGLRAAPARGRAVRLPRADAAGE